METSNNQVTSRPGVLSAMWRYRWLVLVSVAVISALGYLYGASRPPEFVATTSVLAEDPRAAGLFEGPSGSPERYVSDQIALLESTLVAERAAELTKEQFPSADIDSRDFLRDIDVLGGSGSDVIEISFRAARSDVAIAGANAVVAAYEEARKAETAASSTAAIQRLDSTLQDLDEELASISAAIAAERSEEPFRTALDEQLDEATAELLDLWDRLDSTTSPTAQAAIQADLDEVRNELQTLGLIQDLRPEDPEQAVLFRQQQAVLDRRDELETRRVQMLVDAELETDGIVILSAANRALPSGPGLERILAVSIVLGVMAGAGLAYLLAQQRRTFTDRYQPEPILDASLLADIPTFAEEGIKSQLPVKTEPLSAAAESFRHAAVNIDIRGANYRTLMAVSSTLGEGKTTVLANTAIAAARQGTRVLLVDADFGDQSLSRLLLEDEEADIGITELSEGNLDLKDVIRPIPVGDEGSLELIGRGRRPVTAPDFFRSKGAQDFFISVREQFDLVLVDAPPVLQVAYASSVARYADAAVVVVPHDGDVSDLEALASRLQFIGLPTAGYIYNYAPLRAEMIATKKSMRNPLGAETSPELAGRRGHRRRG